MAKTNVYSLLLEKEIELETITQSNEGDEITTISHKSLENIFRELLAEREITHETKWISCGPTFCTVEFHICHEGKDYFGIGCAREEYLTGNIAKEHISLMAHKRAFDIAVKNFLGIMGYYSDAEIPTTGTVISSTVQEKEEPIRGAKVNSSQSTQTAQTAKPQYQSQKPAQSAQPAQPAAQPQSLSIWFGKHKGKDFAELINTENAWCEWYIKNYNPKNEDEKKKFALAQEIWNQNN